MARRRRSYSSVRTVVARTPAPIIRVAAPSMPRVRPYARRSGRAVVSESKTLIPVLAAYLLGMAKKQGISVPTILGMGPAASAGLIAWAIGRWGKSSMASHAAVGLLSVSAYSYGEGGGVAGGTAAVYDDD